MILGMIAAVSFS